MLARRTLFDDISSIFRNMDNLFRSAVEDLGVMGTEWPARQLLPGRTPTSLLAPTARQLPIATAWSGDFYPVADVFQKDGQLVFRLELPGVDPNNVEVSVVNNQLVIRGQKEEEREAQAENVLIREAFHGRFERTFTLPEGVDAEKIKASYQNGVLEVTMPAGELAAAKKVPVEIAESGKKSIKAA